MKTYMVKLTEEELQAVISHTLRVMANNFGDNIPIETTKRLHDLNKILNKNFELSNDPRPKENSNEESSEENPWNH